MKRKSSFPSTVPLALLLASTLLLIQVIKSFVAGPLSRATPVRDIVTALPGSDNTVQESWLVTDR